MSFICLSIYYTNSLVNLHIPSNSAWYSPLCNFIIIYVINFIDVKTVLVIFFQMAWHIYLVNSDTDSFCFLPCNAIQMATVQAQILPKAIILIIRYGFFIVNILFPDTKKQPEKPMVLGPILPLPQAPWQ